MSKQGFIKVYRQIQDHWIYDEKRKFSKYEAWLDMIMLANHKDNKFVLGNELIELKKGQFVTSIRKLGERWDWSNTKVTQFLELLKSDEMVTYKKDTKKTIITIENYGVYHDYDEPKKTQNEHENDTNRTQKHTNKNVKECSKNEKEINTTTNVVQFFEESLCRLSPNQMTNLYEWLDDFKGQDEIIKEAIKIADSKNKRYYGFVEYLLKEWSNAKLDSLERVQAHEKEKFNKQRTGVAKVGQVTRNSEETSRPSLDEFITKQQRSRNDEPIELDPDIL